MTKIRIPGFFLLFCNMVLSVHAQEWGSISISNAHVGKNVTLANSKITVDYKYSGNGAVILRFMLNEYKDDVSQDGPMEYDHARRQIVNATIIQELAERKTVKLEYGMEQSGPPAVTEVTLFKDQPFLRIYTQQMHCCVNDAGRRGKMAIYGSENWTNSRGKKGIVFDQVWGDKLQEFDTGVMYNATGWAPRDPADGGALNYNGWLIFGCYDEATGHGWGRVFQADAVNTIKMWNFESWEWIALKPQEAWERWTEPFVTYLFASTGGKEGLLTLGKQIADMENGGAPPPPPIDPVLEISPKSLQFEATVGGNNPSVKLISVTSEGGLSLDQLTITKNPPANWLSVVQSDTGLTKTLINKVNIVGLQAGNHQTEVSVRADTIEEKYTVNLMLQNANKVIFNSSNGASPFHISMNQKQNQFRFGLDLPAGSQFEIAIHDILGNILWAYQEKNFTKKSVFWEAPMSNYNQKNIGIYFVTLKHGAQKTSKRFLAMR